MLNTNFLHLNFIVTLVNAIMNLKSLYGLKKNWQGDPCAPRGYLWEGLNCSYPNDDSPRITSLYV